MPNPLHRNDIRVIKDKSPFAVQHTSSLWVKQILPLTLILCTVTNGDREQTVTFAFSVAGNAKT
jgi:hypothetical protein